MLLLSNSKNPVFVTFNAETQVYPCRSSFIIDSHRLSLPQSSPSLPVPTTDAFHMLCSLLGRRSSYAWSPLLLTTA